MPLRAISRQENSFRLISICNTEILISKKIGQILVRKENKALIVNSQCVVYKLKCNLCEAEYVGYMVRHLSALEEKQFSILKKCRSKFGMLFIKELRPVSKTQKHSIRAKLFTCLLHANTSFYFIFTTF